MAKSSAAKPRQVAALKYLQKPSAHEATGVCAVFGEDAYLKVAVFAALRRHVLGEGDVEFALTTLPGPNSTFREAVDALASVSLFGDGRRIVVIDDADTFVTEYRQKLEDYAARPYPSSLLVLDVKSWRSDTRLAKAMAAAGLSIDCKSPDERQIKAWLVQQAESIHNARLDAAAAEAILELLPRELGILEQELARLALVVGDDRVIRTEHVRENVGDWRTRTVWQMVDAAADGRAAAALEQLDRLLSAGEKPQGLFPQMSSTLRRFAAATAAIEAAEADRRTLPLRDALLHAGTQPFRLHDAERQLRQITRRRARRLVPWLLSADLAMKGHNSSDDRARGELERLIVRLSAECREPDSATGK
jgi:DNA polymerase-3 subunit delta